MFKNLKIFWKSLKLVLQLVELSFKENILQLDYYLKSILKKQLQYYTLKQHFSSFNIEHLTTFGIIIPWTWKYFKI